jgi:outer membrane usher protein
LSLSQRQINRLGILLMATLISGVASGEQYISSNSIIDNPNDVFTGNESEVVTLYLEVILNQTRQPNLLAITQRDSKLFVQVSDLRQLGFILEDNTATDQVALDSLPGLEVDYRVHTQQLLLNVPLSLLSLPTTKLWAGIDQASPIATASPGILLNYDIYLNHDGDNSLASAATEFRAFGLGHGVFSHTAITRAQQSQDSGWNSETVALDTFGEWSFPENATSLVLGDTVSSGLNWTRPLRLGGIQFSRNFRLQPYRTTTPLTSFIGKATLPSSVELYIDGMRRYQSDVPAGPFELNTAPGITGSGQAQVVTTDILGRTTTVNIPFYTTQQLLAEGLADWSLNLGVVHEDYGIRSFSYGEELVAAGSIRYGMSNNLTMEGHAETSGGLINGGIGAVWQPQLAGVISLAHARSNDSGADGHQTAWRYSWSNNHLNFSAASQRTFGNYRDIATQYGSPPPRISQQILAGVHTPDFGNVGISATRLGYAESDERPSRYAGVYWSKSVNGGIFLNLSYNQNLNSSADRNLQFGINISFDRDYQLSSSVRRDVGKDSYQASLQRSLPSDGGYGWRLQGSHNNNFNNAVAEGSLLGNYGRVDAGVARTGEQDSSYAQASGSLVWMNGHSFASRRINDGFAVVSTSGIPDVPVKLENRIIGYTDDSGDLLVTRLNAWQHNKLSIDPMDLPVDMKVTVVDQITTPRDRAGTSVQFSVNKVRAAIVVLTDVHGLSLPVGSRVQQEGIADSFAVVGFDGETYLEAVQDQNRLRVITANNTCYAEFDYPKSKDPISYIGPLQCIDYISP